MGYEYWKINHIQLHIEKIDLRVEKNDVHAGYEVDNYTYLMGYSS